MSAVCRECLHYDRDKIYCNKFQSSLTKSKPIETSPNYYGKMASDRLIRTASKHCKRPLSLQIIKFFGERGYITPKQRYCLIMDIIDCTEDNSKLIERNDNDEQ